VLLGLIDAQLVCQTSVFSGDLIARLYPENFRGKRQLLSGKTASARLENWPFIPETVCHNVWGTKRAVFCTVTDHKKGYKQYTKGTKVNTTKFMYEYPFQNFGLNYIQYTISAGGALACQRYPPCGMASVLAELRKQSWKGWTAKGATPL
jgi:hypothetical protein